MLHECYVDKLWLSFSVQPGICRDTYRQTFDISRTLVGNNVVDHSDVVGESPAGAVPTTFSFST